LWKTPVDKVVDNVENYGLSTGISLFSLLSTPRCENAYSFAYCRKFNDCHLFPILNYGIMFLTKYCGKVGFPKKFAAKFQASFCSSKKYLLKTDKKDFCIICHGLEIL
jgi:hypothetical protein